jgi:diacylglycerol kinase (ATP)
VRALLVVNPTARQGHVLGDAVREELRRRGVEIVDDESAIGIDAIVVAGGDGTVTREVPRALALGVPIGLVPLGTFNDLARTLAIPLDVDGACAVIAAGRARTIDAARVNGVFFLTEASIGISSRLARLQKTQDKKRFGLVAIAASVLLTAQHARSFHAEIAYDGRRLNLRSVQLTVANSQRFGGFITVDDAAIDDGWLDLYSIEVNGLIQFYSVLAAVAAGRRQSSPGLCTFRSTAFDIRTRRQHRISADGEPAGTTPARFEILPRALRVFVP